MTTPASDTPRRFIEVDLPLASVSEQSRRDKSIRHGHISTLHTWWARRPLPACRAVVLATLVSDPADPHSSEDQRRRIASALTTRFSGTADFSPMRLRRALLDFIAEFALWENATSPAHLKIARELVAACHDEAPPLLADPFRGGGAIPFEGLRVGARVWASDYNPESAFLLRVLLNERPRHGAALADAVRHWGEVVETRMKTALGSYHPETPQERPIAYLWARTVTCEGPGCGLRFPLHRQLCLARRANESYALELQCNLESKHVDVTVVHNPTKIGLPTTRTGSAVCPNPACRFVTSRASVEAQLAARAGGTADARMIGVVTGHPQAQTRSYRDPTDADREAYEAARDELDAQIANQSPGELSLVPDGELNEVRPSPAARGVSAVTRYGMRAWSDLFSALQALALSSFARTIREVHSEIEVRDG